MILYIILKGYTSPHILKHDTTRHNTIQQKSPLDSFKNLYISPRIYPDIKDIQHIDNIQAPTEAQQKPRNIKAPIYTPYSKAPTDQGVKPPMDQKAQKTNGKARKIHEKARKIQKLTEGIDRRNLKKELIKGTKGTKGIEKELKRNLTKEPKELKKGTIYYLTLLYILMYNMLYKLLSCLI